MDDDLNVSAAWGAIFVWISELNRAIAANELSANQAAAALSAWRQVGVGLFGLDMPGEIEVPSDIAALFEARQIARKTKDFKKSDAIRDELKSKGWAIEDTPKGPKLKKL
jgi:cysteinyl-tRNA synthetase